jgi:hypothetical protein
MRKLASVVMVSAAIYACGSDAKESKQESSGGNAGESGNGAAPGDAGRSEPMGGGESGVASSGAAGSSGEAGRAAGSAGEDGGAGHGGTGEGGVAGEGDSIGGEGGAAAGAGGRVPDPVNVPRFSSGTRLKARIQVGSDGSRHLVGFRDTLLDIDCEFANLGPNGYRCAPVQDSGSYYTGAFAEDQCAVPAVGFDAACGPIEQYVASTTPTTCDRVPRRDVFLVGPASTSSFSDDTGECEPYAVEDPNVRWHSLVPADATEFVEGALERMDLGGGLSVSLIEADDGARYASSFWLDEYPCSAIELTDAGVRCVPVPQVQLYSYFLNDTCTTEIGYIPNVTGCALPASLPVRRVVQQDGCSRGAVTLAEVTPFLGSDVFSDHTGTCEPLTISMSGLTRVSIGDAVSGEPLPALVSLETGTARLRGSVFRTENGSSIELTSTIVDTELGEACTAQKFADGIVRCVPSASFFSNYFSDASCTIPVVPASVCATPRFFADAIQDGACPDDSVLRNLYRTATTHTGAVYQRGDEDVCLEAIDPPYAFLSVVAVDPAELVTLTEALE